jgi:hypothetical protein
MMEARGAIEKGGIAAESEAGGSEYSAPVRVLRWFVISLFKIIEGIIRLSVVVYSELKTIFILVFRFFWPYPVYFRRHK